MLAALFLLQTALTLGMPGAGASPEYLAIQVARVEGHFAAELERTPPVCLQVHS